MSKRMAVFLHSLHTGGSQAAVLEMTDLLKEEGIIPEVLAVHDGAFRETFLKRDIACRIIAQPENDAKTRESLLSQYDAVWINSVAAYYFVYFFINTSVPVIWWFHETKEALSAFDGFFPNPLGLSKNIRFAATTKRMQEDLRALYEKESFLLPLSVRDAVADYTTEDHEKVRFLLPGTYKPIKGYDLFLKAILLLPDALRRQAEFVCCGFTYPEDRAYRDAIGETAAKIEGVRILDSLSREELYRLYADCDCVVAPSRLDSGPLTVIEGMMFGKPVIVSDAAGISAELRDCVNAFVFPSGDAEAMMKRMALVIAEKDSALRIGEAGREFYEQQFMPDAVRSCLREMLSGIF